VARKLGICVASILVVLVMAPAPVVLASPRMAASSAASSSSCHWVQMTSRNTGTGDNDLQAVAAISGSDAWAVGQYFVGADTNTLIEHWDGKSWKIVTSPSPGDVNSLNGLYAASARNIWAVGSYASGSSSPQTLIEHWNGTSWKVVKSPNVGALTNALSSVRGTSARDIWAVGYTVTSYPKTTTLVLHWNGTSWKVSKSANKPNTANFLNAVRPVSASNAWAVGEYLHGSSNKTLIEHWSNGRWRVVYSPNGGSSTNELLGVLATSAANAWAVGYWFNQGHSDRTLILHWNGHKWQKAFSPNAGSGSNDVFAVGGTSARDIYAVGSAQTGTGSKVLILHWNGKRWGIVSGRNPGHGNNFSAVFALSPRSVWAVGTENSGGSNRTLIEHCR
jgi:hypothetical protein